MRKWIPAVFFMCLAALMSTACKSTPSAALIAGKSLTTMLAAAKRNPQWDISSIPDTFSCDLLSEDGRVRAYGEVVILVIAKDFSITRCQAADFEQETVDRMLQYFLKDAEMYKCDYTRTKAVIQDEITRLALRQDSFEKEGMLNEYLEQRNALQAEFASAPEGVIPVVSNKQLASVVQEQGAVRYETTGLDIGENSIPQQRARYLFIRNNWKNTSLRGAEFSYCDNRQGQISDCLTIRAQNVTGEAAVRSFANANLHMTPKDAADAAQTFLNELDLPYEVFDVLLIADRVVTAAGLYPEEPSRFSYKVRCTRRIGADCGVLFSVPVQMEVGSYSGSWAYEQFYVYLDDNGIYRIDWASPYTLTETVLDHATLLPYDKIRDIFNKNILYRELSADESSSLKQLDMEITDVYLGTQRIIQENSIDNGLLIPVWSFFGVLTYEYQDGSREIYDSKIEARPLLVINAIDGTIIDPLLGY